ncbi:ABC transporter permease [Abyssisolibacter fermentans]|uniref:ABC transporter permease n=1 Tax=Abyssisolibacter fermentans TaxID=1766203 RepID=UPI00083733DF|nr:ABC transporter permease [Abyssisolibacter fermentans]
MIKRIFNLISKEKTSLFRNNMVIYAILFPILLAFVMRMFLPSMESMKLSVAVDSSIDTNFINELRNFGNVEQFDNYNDLQKRIEKPDDICGITKKDNQYVVILEGNEAGEAKEIASSLMNMILSEKPKAQFEHISLQKTSSKNKEITASLLLLTSILIGGFMIGLSIVEEKESKSIRALAVSPIKMFDFVVSHTIICSITSIVLSVLSVFILMGTNVNYGQIIIASLATTGIGVILGYLIGLLADNLISSIAVIKVLLFTFIGVAFGSLFVPQNLHWVFYIFPHYWGFQSYMNIFSSEPLNISFATSCGIAFIYSVLVLLILTHMMKKKLKFR